MSKDGLTHIRTVHDQVAGRWVRTVKVLCSSCRKEKQYPCLPKDTAAKWLTQRGWLDAAAPKRAVCPDCAVARTTLFLGQTKPKPLPIPLPPVEPSGVTIVVKRTAPMAVSPSQYPKPDPKADAPRAAKPADNRRIADELEVHYDTDRLCYRGIASDLMIAGKLDVPRAWVADVREKMYGPEVPEAMRDAPARLSAFEAEFKALEDKALALATEAEAARKRLKGYLKSIEGVGQ